MSEFIAMDGFAIYVWPSFAVTVGFLVVMAVLPWLRLRRLQRELVARPPAGGGS